MCSVWSSSSPLAVSILSTPAIYRWMTLAHELSHKVLKTSDKVYELPECKRIKDTADAVACADSWGRALTKREPSLSIPCFAERRYGGVPDEEMLMALKPADLCTAIHGMQALAKNGLRYPIPPFGIQSDPSAGMGRSYAGKS